MKQFHLITLDINTVGKFCFFCWKSMWKQVKKLFGRFLLKVNVETI